MLAADVVPGFMHPGNAGRGHVIPGGNLGRAWAVGQTGRAISLFDNKRFEIRPQILCEIGYGV